MKKRLFYLALLALLAVVTGFVIYAPSKLGLVIFAAFISFWLVSIFQHPLFLLVLLAISLWLIISRKKITFFPLALFAISLGIIMFGNPQAKPFTNADNATKKPVIPFAYLKGNYKGNIKGTWRRHDGTDVPYEGVDYKVWEANPNMFEHYCGVSELSNYKDPDQQYYTLNKAKLFGGAIKMRCSYYGFEGQKPSHSCNIDHPIAANATVGITFNTAYDVPKDQWNSFFADFAKHIENQMPANEIPNLKQICTQLKNQHNNPSPIEE